MIVEAILNPIFAFLQSIFSLINMDKLDLPFWLGDMMSLLAKAMMFFPIDVWVVVILNIVFWITAQCTWAIIEWIYKKIPGVN